MAARLLTMTGVILLSALVAQAPALAQSTSSKMNGIALSSNEPIHIESDKLEIKDKENRADFNGNVVVIQGSTKLQANHMIVYYKSSGSASISGAGSGDIDRILVDGKVLLLSGTQKATGDNGEFDMNAQTLVLKGKQVVLSEGENIFVGCQLTVQMQSGQAQLDSCGGRVQIQLDPKSRK